ncbi:MAG TPA: hypothetical protein VK716_16685 [Terracidiphilus sp.]|jgi:hypothetical protein|nr:hypothetical protein [Terracidiphilus sp.]
MQPDTQIVMGRREYAAKTWKRALWLILGAFLLGASFLMGASGAFSAGHTAALIPALFFVGGGLWSIASALRSRLAIDGTRIEVQTAFRDRTAELGEIAGYRTVQTRNGSYTELQLKNGAGTVSIPNDFDVDGDYQRWMAQIPNLDEKDREELLEEIQKREDLGATPEERLGALATAKTIGIFATVVAVVLAIASNFGPTFFQVLAGALLALAPVFVFVMIKRSPLLYAVLKRKKDPRAELMFVLMAASFAYLFSLTGVHLVSLQSAAPLILALACFYCAPALAGGLDKTQLFGKAIALVFLGGMYGFSLTVAVDARLDQAQATPYRTTVASKYVSHGRSTSYIFYLAPWGPFDGTNRVGVSSKTYYATEVGDTVCVDLHPGALHLAWFDVVNCWSQSPPATVP